MTPTDFLSEANRVIQRTREIGYHEIEARSRLVKLDKQRSESNAALATSRETQTDLVTVLEIFKELAARLSAGGVKALEELLSRAYAGIFWDRELFAKVAISDWGKSAKTCEFRVLKAEDGAALDCDIKDSVGGGVQTVTALIIRIFFIIATESARVLFLDESLVQLSAHYHEALFAFLRSLHEELGFDFLFITHLESFVDLSDTVYMVKAGEVTRRT